jgi:hypothetical protein
MGNLLWQDVIASAFGYGHRVVAAGTGNAYVLGRASGSTSIDIVTLKYSSAGVREWARYFGFDSTSADSPSSLVLTPAGNVLVAGGAVGKMLMVAYDPNGNPIWSKAVAASTGTTDIAVAATGEFYAIGGISNGTGTEQTLQHRTAWRRIGPNQAAAELDIVPVGLPVRAHASGTIVESASGRTRMELIWQVDSMLDETVERQFADQVKAALDDDHTFTLQYLDQAAVR